MNHNTIIGNASIKYKYIHTYMYEIHINTKPLFFLRIRHKLYTQGLHSTDILLPHLPIPRTALSKLIMRMNFKTMLEQKITKHKNACTVWLWIVGINHLTWGSMFGSPDPSHSETKELEEINWCLKRADDDDLAQHNLCSNVVNFKGNGFM